MSTDPLSEAIGRSEPAQPSSPAPAPGPQASAQDPGPEIPPQAPPHEPADAAPAQDAAAPPYEPPPTIPAGEQWAGPDAERSLLERRPEILVGAALAGGFIAAQLLGRARGR